MRYFSQTGDKSFEDVEYGDTVRFIPIDGPRGLRGVDVEIL